MSCRIKIEEQIITGNFDVELTVNVEIKSTSGNKGEVNMKIPNKLDVIFKSTGTTEKNWSISDVSNSYKTIPLKFTIVCNNPQMTNFTASFTFTDSSNCSDSDENLVRLKR